MDHREGFLTGVLSFSDAMHCIGLNPSKMTVVLGEEDGRRLEHLLLQQCSFVVSERNDPRYSQPNEDGTREFYVAGVRFAYRAKLWKMPSGKIV